MDRRQVFGWVGVLLCLGVPIAWALTGSFSDTIWTAPIIKGDNYYVGAAQDVTGLLTGYVSATGTLTLPHLVVEGVPLATYITSVAPGGTTVITQASPYSYIVSKTGGTYYANSTTGGTNYSNANFVTMMNTLITAMSAGQTIFIKSGTYTVDSTINGATGISICGVGPSTILDASTMAAVDTAIAYIGSLAAGVAIASNCTLGDNHIHCNEATFAANDLIYIHTDAVWDSNDHNIKQGELQYVGSTAGGLLNFRQGTAWDTYLSASGNAFVQKVTPVKDFYLRDFKLLGSAVEADRHYGIEIFYGVNVELSGLFLDGLSERTIHIDTCDKLRIVNCNINRAYETGMGYGVGVDYACSNIVIADCNFDYCRHSVTLEGGTTEYGVPRNVVVSGCTSRDSRQGDGDAFDTHNNGEAITYIGCTAIGGRQGFNVPGHGINVIGCTAIDNSEYGFAVGSYIAVKDVRFIGCVSKNAYQHGFYVSTTAADAVEISDCEVIDAGFNGIDINGGNGVVISDCKIIGANRRNADADFSSIFLEGDTNYTLIKDCVFKKGTYTGHHIRIAAGTCDKNMIWNCYYDDTAASGVLHDAGTGTVDTGNITRP